MFWVWTVVVSKLVASNSFELDQSMLESDLSLDVIAELNETKEYKPFNISEFTALKRRLNDVEWYNVYADKPFTSKESLDRTCHLLVMTFQMASKDIEKFFPKRLLYMDNLEYEVGYLVHEIVYKYQMMIEVYHLVVNRYYLAQDKYYAPVQYLFYMYNNELEFSMAIFHLCNMLHELEKKYKEVRAKKKSLFADDDSYSKTTRKRRPRNRTEPDQKESYFQKIEKVEQRKKKERKKERKHFEKYGVLRPTTPARRKTNRSSWPLAYGWSIEDW